MKRNCSISVIIRSKNEERWIGHTIQSVINFLHKPTIVVVDNNSTDGTIKIVQHFQQDPELNDENGSNYTKTKVLYIDDYSPGRAINLGVKNSDNDYILSISSHCVLMKFNEAKHKKDLEKYACVYGNQIPVWEGKKIKKRYIWSHFQDKEVINMYSEMEDRYFMHNALAFFKKQTLLDFPFDEHLVGKEDRYWANDIIKKAGLNILYDPQMEVHHHYTENGNTWKGIG